MEFLNVVNFLLAAFIVIGPICLGTFMVFFSRRFSLDSLRFREGLWKIGFTEFDVRVGQIGAVVLGAGLVVVGLISAARLFL